MNSALLDIYSDYLISQGQYATATGLAEMLNGEVSHDQISRFLRAEDYGSKEMWQYVKPQVRQHEQSGGVLILDDTISEKAYTDENAINCWHHSHAKHRHVKGINLLSCLVRYEKIALPIGYAIVNKNIEYCDVETKRQKRKSAVTKNDLFCELIAKAISNQVLFDYILADNWFGSKANMTFIHHLQKSFIIGIKANRCVALTNNGQFQQVNTLDWKSGVCHTVSIKSIKNGGKLKSFINQLNKMPA